ncbi:stage II sporulation protein P [Salibacterium salarium]|uniref:Stage II sporulation protein P n=1 Tax=Salibacterium salarium TaxID=284579 RepID=A0A3R9P7H8_9BACI|nr:stage II sporulation protein P [Salibacterium salarium]RSL34465.1 stage II sporulation protein P [Salibacterium salarium]
MVYKNKGRTGLLKKRTSIRKIIMTGMAGYLLVMFIIAVLTSSEDESIFSSRQLHTWSSEVQKELLISLFTYENRYFINDSDVETESISNMLFEFATRLDFHEPRTLLGREIPGFASFDGKIVVAGDGADFTNMPIESAPPLEVLLEEREATADRLEIMDDSDQEVDNASQTNETIAHIIHSHSRESYLPELEEGTENAFHSDVNITMVGQRLGEQLEKHGIGTTVDKTDIEKRLHEKGWEFPQSYDVSRTVLQEAIEENDQLELFFDLHRDSQPRDITTATINGETVARTYFVIGENNPHYEKNLEMAKDLHHRLNDKYPGISRGVLTKGGVGANGRYNQDLSEKSILIEVGGIENSLNETYRTADKLAEVISEQYFESKEEGE